MVYCSYCKGSNMVRCRYVFYFQIEQQINFGFKFSEIYTNKSKNLRRPVPIFSSYSGCRVTSNGIAGFKKCKQLFEYQHLLLLRDIWHSKF